MKLWQLILLLGNCVHYWTLATAHSARISHSTLKNVERRGNSTILRIVNSNIKFIRRHAFDKLPHLTELDLSGNRIESLSPGVFSKLHNLKKLSLFASPDVYLRDLELDENVFRGLNNLECLDLTGYYFPELKSGYFAGLPKFVNITVDAGAIGLLSTAVFKDEFDLAPTREVRAKRSRKSPRNPASSYLYPIATYRACITNGILESVEETPAHDNCTHPLVMYREYGNSLYLHFHNISGFRKNWYGATMPYFYGIRIWYSHITDITPELINDLPSNIMNIDLYYNAIKTIKNNGIVNGNLRILSLEDHSIDTIEDGAFEKLNLTELSIISNSKHLNSTKFIRTLPSTLEIFNFEKSSVAKIDSDTFSHLKKLKKLSMVSHKLTSLELDIFNGLENLEVIDFRSNSIYELQSGLFTGLNKLSTISFSNNRIKEIQSYTFKGLNLSKLDLSINKLKIIRTETYLNSSINELILRLNKISSIETRAFNGAHIIRINLDNNSLTEFKKESWNGISGVEHFISCCNPLKIIEKGSMLNLREAKYVDFESTSISALENGMLYGLSTDDVHVVLENAPITLIQGGVFDEA